MTPNQDATTITLSIIAIILSIMLTYKGVTKCGTNQPPSLSLSQR